MKLTAGIFKTLFSVVLLLAAVATTAARAQGFRIPEDSMEVSLITCEPHDEIYSLYGHTAIRFNDQRQGGGDWVFSYGVFNYNKPFFALRFTLGKTDYELGVAPFSAFYAEYSRRRRPVYEQVLNLTTDEKLRLKAALLENFRPENRVYRYNFFYDNCTTRARDMIESAVDGNVVYAQDGHQLDETYRKMVHRQLEGHPWAAFADDLCLGQASDRSIDSRQQQFLPERLMGSFAQAGIERNGIRQPLVSDTYIMVAGNHEDAAGDLGLTPTHCAWALLILTVAVTGLRRKWRLTAKVFDVALLTVVGVAGIVITVLLFSEHPTTNTNLQVLLLNPLPLVFIPSIVRGKVLFWKIYSAMLVIFLVGGLFQDYAEGMHIVALCLLIRCIIHLLTAHFALKKAAKAAKRA